MPGQCGHGSRSWVRATSAHLGSATMITLGGSGHGQNPGLPVQPADSGQLVLIHSARSVGQDPPHAPRSRSPPRHHADDDPRPATRRPGHHPPIVTTTAIACGSTTGRHAHPERRRTVSTTAGRVTPDTGHEPLPAHRVRDGVLADPPPGILQPQHDRRRPVTPVSTGELVHRRPTLAPQRHLVVPPLVVPGLGHPQRPAGDRVWHAMPWPLGG
jgi:hypothetical protein